MNEERKTKLTNPERIARILRRICDAGMPGLIRTREAGTVAIRARFHQIKTYGEKSWVIVNAVSEKGVKRLSVGTVVQVEILGMASKVIFTSRVGLHIPGGIALVMPESLVSVERRQNARYATTPALMAYIKPSIWQPKPADLAAPPIFDLYESLANWCVLADMSLGGACVHTRFPSILATAEMGAFDQEAELILPMHAPIKVPIEVRWQKRIREHVKVEGAERYQLHYRFGILFVNPEQSTLVAIRQFLKQLAMAEAI